MIHVTSTTSPPPPPIRSASSSFPRPSEATPLSCTHAHTGRQLRKRPNACAMGERKTDRDRRALPRDSVAASTASASGGPGSGRQLRQARRSVPFFLTLASLTQTSLIKKSLNRCMVFSLRPFPVSESRCGSEY